MFMKPIRFPFLLPVLLLLSFSTLHARPNVILIVTDDQGYGDMSCHGNPWLNTPNLDRLKAEGVSLDDYHVDPFCTPTRAALMTGRYSTRVGAWAVTEGRQLLNANETTMADAFKASGYATAMFGKWHLGDPFPYAPQYRGFDDVVCHKAGGVGEIGNPAGNDYFDDIYYRNGKPERFQGYCTDVFFGEALRFIEQRVESKNENPFFVYLPLNAMHGPFTVAEKYSKPFAEQGIPEPRSLFYGMIQNFDENLGRLLQSLNEWKIEENTLVIFMGDNGTAAGIDRGAKNPAGFNAGMRGKKGSPYEGGHRVACFARWPGTLPAGSNVDQLTMHCDWLPTLVELCDLTKPKQAKWDGRSIAPLLAGQTKRWDSRTLFVSRQGDRLEKWSPESKGIRYPHFAALTERWRYVDGELYDILNDPSQTKDLAAQYPEVAQSLYEQYGEWFDDVSAEGGAYTRFLLGSNEENPTQFTTRDWHPTDGGVIWKMELVQDDTLFVNGFWTVDIQRSGRYEIRIARYPEDADQPAGANQARIQIGDIDQRTELDPSDVSATFKVNLKKGPTQLKTWLRDAQTGKERGAYYIKVTRI